MKKFPKPKCDALVALQLEQVKEQMQQRSKHPHFQFEKSLYKVQIFDLHMGRSQQASVLAEDTLLLTQLALVLVGSVPHAITVERQKIAWAHINPKMKPLATEDYEKQEIKLYVPGFLEKASKRVEVQVSPRENPMPKRKGILNKGRSFENEKCDLRSFKSKGAPAQYGGRKN